MMSNELPFPNEGESKVDIFQRKEIRKILHNGEWWFSVKDVLEAYTDTTDGNRYSRDLRAKDEGLKATWAEITRTLPFETKTRGIQDMTFINIEGSFRLIQSFPTAKAEPFKRWLAKVGFERLQEENNPDLVIKRAIAIYRSKGYDDEWIDARIRNKASREILTTEWHSRGMTEYISIFTDAICMETFGVSIKTHKQIKGLKNQSLRDNMTPIELTLTTLGEQTTTEIVKSTNAQTYQTNLNASRMGGHIAGDARKGIERATGKKVVSSQNYLTAKQRENNAKTGNGALNDTLKRILNLPGQVEPKTKEETENDWLDNAF